MELSTGNSLSIITWNTCGVKPTKDSNKLMDIMDYGEKQKADVILLQETHIGPNCYRKLEKHGRIKMERHWTSYFTVYSPRSKGVAILVNEKLKPHYEYICHDEDYAGGYIVLFCQMYGQLFTLVNVYNHKEDKKVLGRLSQYLQEMKIGTLVIGGDFNTVLDLDIDKRTASEHRRHTSLQPLLQSFISSLNLQDTWARLQPTEKAFTRSQGTSHSRIDMFFILHIQGYWISGPIHYYLYKCKCILKRMGYLDVTVSSFFKSYCSIHR
uniref:exodeoxyribonuclease III n=1 Tax=Oncorhynchus mykiss TaxID=8022 RepID=A0A8C7RTP2_ONCMY